MPNDRKFSPFYCIALTLTELRRFFLSSASKRINTVTVDIFRRGQSKMFSSD